MKTLKVSKEVSLPIDVVTQTIAILAKRRAGKSYTMRRITEQLLENSQQVVVVDPKGDQWGIRSSADGKTAGYPIIILGGEHGDIPLEVNAGEVVAKLVVEERVSILLDLSEFRKYEIATFMTAFLENLYRLKAKEEYRTPVMLVIDEADAIAPQKPQKGEERMLGAAEDIVRRGGQRGIGCILVTQRSAVLNKNVLTQAQMLVVLRTIAPQDLAAMNAWIEVHGTLEQKKVLMESLPSLPTGDAWFWSPGWPTEEGIFKRTHVLPIETFDSGATPKPGEHKIVPKNLADVDLNALKSQMAETIERAKNDDPRLLKKRIADLEKAQTSTTTVEVEKIVEKPILTDKQITDLTKIVEKIHKENERHEEISNALAKSFHEVGATIGDSLKAFAHPMIFVDIDKVVTPASPTEKASYTEVKPETKPTGLSVGARAILSYLHGAYPHAKTKTQMWVATGYSPSGYFNNLVYELTGAGLIQKVAHGYVSLERHEENMIDPDFCISLSIWDSRLSVGARKIFHLLMEYADTSLSKEEISQKTEYEQSGYFNNLIYELTGKELIKKIGTSYQINPEILNL